MDLQALVNALSDSARDTRKLYHITLGDLIDKLKNAEPSTKVVLDFDVGIGVSSPHSYRGYYADLALSPDDGITTAGELLESLNAVLDTELEGYKGGEFLMSADTPLWIAYYSYTGRAVVDVELLEDVLVLITKEVD